MMQTPTDMTKCPGCGAEQTAWRRDEWTCGSFMAAHGLIERTGCLRAQRDAWREKYEALAGKLPKFKDTGEPIVPGDELWFPTNTGRVEHYSALGALTSTDVLVLPMPTEIYTITDDWDCMVSSRCYSTESSARTAQKEASSK